MKLLPSRHVLCTPYNNAPCHFMQSHIRKVYACIAVICHLHFWQNDRGLLRATAVTRGWNEYQTIISQHNKLSLEKKKKIRKKSRDSNPRPFNHKSGGPTTELSTLPSECDLDSPTVVFAPVVLSSRMASSVHVRRLEIGAAKRNFGDGILNLSSGTQRSRFFSFFPKNNNNNNKTTFLFKLFSHK